MPIKKKSRFNYYTDDRYPTFKRERRIKVPPVPKRPVRFQLRSVLDMDLITPPPFPGLVIHRRGPTQPWMGTLPLEMRASPHSEVRGTLPERIIYKYLTVSMKFQEGIDFNFQSSLQGGRIDTGGIVADFIFPSLRLVINPLGPTHSEFIRMKKDQEQLDELSEMGYQVYMIPEADIYDEPTFIRKMRQIFGWLHSGAGSSSEKENDQSSVLDALLGLEAAVASI